MKAHQAAWGVGDVVLVGLALLLAFALAMALAACAGSNQDVVTASHAADGAAFNLELQACVAQSATAGQYADCRAETIARWCGDAGALSSQGACTVDGGPVGK